MDEHDRPTQPPEIPQGSLTPALDGNTGVPPGSGTRSDHGDVGAAPAGTVVPTPDQERYSAELSSGLPQIPGYHTTHEIKRGGMGVVYEARDIDRNRTVALKMIRGATD